MSLYSNKHNHGLSQIELVWEKHIHHSLAQLSMIGGRGTTISSPVICNVLVNNHDKNKAENVCPHYWRDINAIDTLLTDDGRPDNKLACR